MSLNDGYGSRKRSIDSGDPFRKGTGLFLRAGQCRDGTANAAGLPCTRSSELFPSLHLPQARSAEKFTVTEITPASRDAKSSQQGRTHGAAG